MPNLKGGKAYKKTKHASNEDPQFIELAKDQMYGKIIRNLGGLNMMVFCNDNKERICHIRGSMRRKVWMNPGDIIILSLREMSETDSKERGDIVAKVDPKFYTRLRNSGLVNEHLFNVKETGVTTGELGGFVFDNSGENEDNSEKDSKEDSEEENTKVKPKTPQHVNARTGNYVENDEVDIDDI